MSEGLRPPQTPRAVQTRGVAGIDLGLASNRQVASINPLDAFDTPGQLDGPLPFLFTGHEASQDHYPSGGIDVNG